MSPEWSYLFPQANIYIYLFTKNSKGWISLQMHMYIYKPYYYTLRYTLRIPLDWYIYIMYIFLVWCSITRISITSLTESFCFVASEISHIYIFLLLLFYFLIIGKIYQKQSSFISNTYFWTCETEFYFENIGFMLAFFGSFFKLLVSDLVNTNICKKKKSIGLNPIFLQNVIWSVMKIKTNNRSLPVRAIVKHNCEIPPHFTCNMCIVPVF